MFISRREWENMKLNVKYARLSQTLHERELERIRAALELLGLELRQPSAACYVKREDPPTGR